MEARTGANTTRPARRLEDWVRRLCRNELPILAASRHACEELSAAQDTGVRDLARIAYCDPALAINLLHTANRLRHLHLDTRTVSVEQAIMMLGVERVQTLVSGFATAQGKLVEDALEGYLTTCSHAVHTAIQARRWAERRQDILPSEVATAALVRCVGDLAMWQALPGRMKEARELGGDLPQATQQAQYVVLGVTMGELSAGLVRHCRLPLLVLEHLIPDKVTGRRTLGLALAGYLSQLGALGWRHPAMQSVLATVSSYLGMESDVAIEHIRDTVRLAAEECPGDLPRPWESLLQEPEAGAATTSAGREFCIVPRPTIAHALLRRCAAGRDQRALSGLRLKHRLVEDLDVPLSLALRCLHHGHGLSRAIFLRLSRDGDFCLPYMALGCEGDPHLPDLRLSTLPRSRLFRHLHAPQPEWLDEDAMNELRRELPPRGRQLLFASSSFLAAIRDGDGLLGLLYADRLPGHCRLDHATFGGFRAVVEALETGLRQARCD